MAKKEGREFQALLDEAIKDYIEKKTSSFPKKNVIEAFQESMAVYDELYKMLAK